MTNVKRKAGIIALLGVLLISVCFIMQQQKQSVYAASTMRSQNPYTFTYNYVLDTVDYDENGDYLTIRDHYEGTSHDSTRPLGDIGVWDSSATPIKNSSIRVHGNMILSNNSLRLVYKPEFTSSWDRKSVVFKVYQNNILLLQIDKNNKDEYMQGSYYVWYPEMLSDGEYRIEVYDESMHDIGDEYYNGIKVGSRKTIGTATCEFNVNSDENEIISEIPKRNDISIDFGCSSFSGEKWSYVNVYLDIDDEKNFYAAQNFSIVYTIKNLTKNAEIVNRNAPLSELKSDGTMTAMLNVPNCDWEVDDEVSLRLQLTFGRDLSIGAYYDETYIYDFGISLPELWAADFIRYNEQSLRNLYRDLFEEAKTYIESHPMDNITISDTDVFLPMSSGGKRYKPLILLLYMK